MEGRPLLVGAVGDFGGNRCGGVSPAAVGRKNRGGPALRLHRRPPQPGSSGLALLVGFGAGATGAALAWGLFLPVLRDAFRPLAWVARSLLGQWEPRQAKFVGWVQESDGDGGVRSYPFVLPGAWPGLFPAVTRQKHFAPGDILTVYKSPKGRFSLEPEPLDYLLIPIALLPVFFVGLFVSLPFGDGGLSVVDRRHRAGGLPVTGLSVASNHFFLR